MQRELDACRLQVEELKLSYLKANAEIELQKRELEQAKLQRKALRATVNRWTDEAAHERACRVAAETLLRAAAGFTDASSSVVGASAGSVLTPSQQQQLRGILDAVAQ